MMRTLVTSRAAPMFAVPRSEIAAHALGYDARADRRASFGEVFGCPPVIAVRLGQHVLGDLRAGQAILASTWSHGEPQT